MENERPAPDIKCGWTSADKYGAALSWIACDSGLGEKAQVEFCYAVQEFAKEIGFPKGKEPVVVSLLKGLYKSDIAEAEGQIAYKEDEEEGGGEWTNGKQKVMIQGMAWFNWLEEDDDSSEEESDEE